MKTILLKWRTICSTFWQTCLKKKKKRQDKPFKTSKEVFEDSSCGFNSHEALLDFDFPLIYDEYPEGDFELIMDRQDVESKDKPKPCYFDSKNLKLNSVYAGDLLTQELRSIDFLGFIGGSYNSLEGWSKNNAKCSS